MVFAGLRISEFCSLRWWDVDLEAGWLRVEESKTDAGTRRLLIRGALHDELAKVRAARRSINPDGYVFPTRTGRRQFESKVRTNILGSAVTRANKNLIARDQVPLPVNVTPHSLRRTFATVLYALGEPAPMVMAEMGDTSPNLALKVYAQAMRLADSDKADLAALMDGEKADKGTKADVVPIDRGGRRSA